LNIVPFIDAYLARELLEHGQEDLAVQQWRAITDDMVDAGNYANIDLPMMFAAEALIARGDFDEADVEIERLVATTANRGWKSREITILRLRALLAQARGDDAAYGDLRDRYRAMANDLGFEGHMRWAAEMR
jgi:adenylate cyclase